MTRRVTYVKFHQEVFVPGVGSLGNTLPAPSKALALDMQLTESYLLIRTGGKEIAVPTANVVLAVLEPKE